MEEEEIGFPSLLLFLFGYMEEVGGKECLRWNVRAFLMKV